MRKMSCALWKVQVCPSLVGDDTVMCAGDNEFYKWEYDPLLHTHPDEGLEGDPREEDLILLMCHRVPQVCHSHFSTKRPTDVSHIVEAHGCVTPDICVFTQ